MPADSFADRLRSLRDGQRLSRSQLSRRTAVVDDEGVGIPEITIKFLERATRTQLPERKTMLLLAKALDVPPETFPEYRLQVARARLDPREVGLDEALMMLDAIETAMQLRAVGATQPPPSAAPPARGDRERRTSRGG